MKKNKSKPIEALEEELIVRPVRVNGNALTNIGWSGSTVREVTDTEFAEAARYDDCHVKPIDVKIDSNHGKRSLKHCKMTDGSGSTAMDSILQFPRACADAYPSIMLLLICMVALVYDILFPLLGGLAINLSGMSALPPAMLSLMSALAGDESWSGGRWKVKAPHILMPRIKLGQQAVANHLRDYAPLEIVWHNRILRLAAPYFNRAVVLDSGFPETIKKAWITTCPFAIPIYIGNQVPKGFTRTLTLDGNALWACNSEFFTQLDANADNISALLLRFGEEMRCHPKRLFKTVQARLKWYLPSQQDGLFTRVIAANENPVKAVLMALLWEFLNWAIEEQFCSSDDANAFYHTVWGIVLPESAPNQARTAEKGQAASALRMDDARCFGLFLSEYIAEHCNHIKLPEEPWTPDAVGLIRHFEAQPEPLVIFDRRHLLDNYLSYIKRAGGDASFFSAVKESEFPAKLQRALMDAGVPIRDGGRDVTWRYAMYPKSVETHKTPALGLPTSRLIAFWHTLQIPVDKTVEQLLTLERDINKPDQIIVPESSENAGESA